MDYALWIVLVAILTPAVYYDVSQHRIPNRVALIGWIVGPLLHLSYHGLEGLASSLIALGAAFLLTYPLFLINWMGAGDIKLMVSVAAVTGINHAFYILLGIALSGMLFALVVMAIKGRLKMFMASLYLSGPMGRVGAIIADARNNKDPIIIPYAIPIAMGSLLVFGIV